MIFINSKPKSLSSVLVQFAGKIGIISAVISIALLIVTIEEVTGQPFVSVIVIS